MAYTILVCDDDEDIVSAISIYLAGEGYRVIQAYDGFQALEALQAQTVHLIIMDIMMPGLDGLRAVVRIREERNVPILLLSAKSEDTDKVLGLNLGADDYMTKPFNAVELLARVRSQLRRYASLGGMETQPGVLRIGGLELCEEQHRAFVDGNEATLTPIEFGILSLLMRHPEQVFSSAQIYQHVWQEPAFDVAKTVSVHIRHLREKIEIDPKVPRYLKVVYGVGYKISRSAR